MEMGIIIKNIIITSVLLGVAFLSQMPEFRFVGNNVTAQWEKGSEWVKASVIGASVTQEITKQKDNVVQNLWENFKSYFAEKFSKTFGTKVE